MNTWKLETRTTRFWLARYDKVVSSVEVGWSRVTVGMLGGRAGVRIAERNRTRGEQNVIGRV